MHLLITLSFFTLFSLPCLAVVEAPTSSTSSILLPAEVSTPFGDEYRSVKGFEGRIKYLDSRLKLSRFSTEDFFRKIVNPLNRGGSWQSGVWSWAWSETSNDSRDSFLEVWERENSAFHEERYRLMGERQALIIRLVHVKMTELLDPRPLNPEGSEKWLILNNLFKEWENFKDHLMENATSKNQRARIYAFREYFKKVREILVGLHQASAPSGLSNSNWGERAQGLVKRSLVDTYLFWQVLGRDVGSFVSSPFETQSSGPPASQAVFSNYTPFTTRGGMVSRFNADRQKKGIEVAVIGRENLKGISLDATPHDKVVNFFIPSHRGNNLDQILIAALDLPHFIIFGNPRAFMPTDISSRLLSMTPEFIAVGDLKGVADPTEKLLLDLEEKRTPNIVNYAQGFVPVTGENLPIRDSVVRTLFARLLKEGYKIRVIPITFHVDSEFLSDSGEGDQLKISATIHPPIMEKAVEELVYREIPELKGRVGYNVIKEKKITAGYSESGMIRNGFIEHYLNSIWYDELEKCSEDLSIDQMIDRANRTLHLDLRNLI